MTCCKFCNCELNIDNRAGKRKSCKPCRSKETMQWAKDNNGKRKAYINSYVRKIGKVKQYPCLTCQTLCYKKYAKAFCSDKCRFLSYVKVTDTCWLWLGAINHQGYGKLSFKNYKTDPAHRVSYKLFNGEIPEGISVCHSCDIKQCVKPAHLWLGTHKDNMADMVKKNRQHRKLTPDDVLKIRELVEKYGVKQEIIKEQFNLTSGTVSSIINRRLWKHI